MELANSKTNDVLSVFLPYLFFFFCLSEGFLCLINILAKCHK